MKFSEMKYPIGMPTNIADRVRNLALRVAGSGRSRHRAIHFCKQAWNAIQSKRWEDARFFAEAAVRADSDFPDGYRMLGYARLRVGFQDGARQAYLRGLESASTDTPLMMALGDLETEVGQHDRAEQWYEQAAAIMSESPDILLRLGNAALRNNHLGRAAEVLGKANRLLPNDLRILAALGTLLRRQGDFKGAVQALTVVVSRQPASPSTQYDLGLSLAALAQWDQAFRHAQSALSLEPGNQDFERLLSVIEGNIREGST